MSSILLTASLKQTHKSAIIFSIQRSTKCYSKRGKYALQNTRENEN